MQILDNTPIRNAAARKTLRLSFLSGKYLTTYFILDLSKPNVWTKLLNASENAVHLLLWWGKFPNLCNSFLRRLKKDSFDSFDLQRDYLIAETRIIDQYNFPDKLKFVPLTEWSQIFWWVVFISRAGWIIRMNWPECFVLKILAFSYAGSNYFDQNLEI